MTNFANRMAQIERAMDSQQKKAELLPPFQYFTNATDSHKVKREKKEQAFEKYKADLQDKFPMLKNMDFDDFCDYINGMENPPKPRLPKDRGQNPPLSVTHIEFV